MPRSPTTTRNRDRDAHNVAVPIPSLASLAGSFDLTMLAEAIESNPKLGRTADDHRQLLDAIHGSPEQARAELTAHLQVGAAELQRLLDLLAQRKELAHRKEREAPRG
jgi:hypothetical protein